MRIIMQRLINAIENATQPFKELCKEIKSRETEDRQKFERERIEFFRHKNDDEIKAHRQWKADKELAREANKATILMAKNSVLTTTELESNSDNSTTEENTPDWCKEAINQLTPRQKAQGRADQLKVIAKAIVTLKLDRDNIPLGNKKTIGNKCHEIDPEYFGYLQDNEKEGTTKGDYSESRFDHAWRLAKTLGMINKDK